MRARRRGWTAAAAPTGSPGRRTGRGARAGSTRGWPTCCAARWRRRSCGTPSRRERSPPGCCAGRGTCWRRRSTGGGCSPPRRAEASATGGGGDSPSRRPSRRAAAVSGVVLPALRRPVPELAVVCDTSGSMSEDLLAMALSEVEGLLRALGLARQLRVLACDAAAGPAQRVSSARQVTLTGGGGTNMGAGLAAGHALRRPPPAVTVVLTDGYTPWPPAAPKGMLVVAGLLGDDAPEAPGWARAVRVP